MTFADAVKEVEAMGARRSQELEEAEQFIEYMRPHKPKVYLEIGTRHGWFFYLVGKLLKPEVMIAVDLPGVWPWGDEGSQDVLTKVAESLGGERHLIFGDSKELYSFERVLVAINGRKIDFLFIDGDHKYEGVKHDWENYTSLVRSGGHVAFHDILPSTKHGDKKIEVDQLWNEIRKDYEHHEIVAAGSKMGIGILTL